MGGSNNKPLNKNLLVIGNYIDTDVWIKDINNSSIDFVLFTYSLVQPNIFLWCPDPDGSPLLKLVIESLISQIYFEGLLYIFSYNQNQAHQKNNKSSEHRNQIHQIMNEETMRQAVLYVLVIVSGNDEITNAFDEEGIKKKIEEELEFSELDSKQPRQLFILNVATMDIQDESVKKKYDFTSIVTAILGTADKTHKKEK